MFRLQGDIPIIRNYQGRGGQSCDSKSQLLCYHLCDRCIHVCWGVVVQWFGQLTFNLRIQGLNPSRALASILKILNPQLQLAIKMLNGYPVEVPFRKFRMLIVCVWVSLTPMTGNNISVNAKRHRWYMKQYINPILILY